MRKILLSPSLLSADCAKLGEMAQLAVTHGADRLHFDVMDNHYVPNLTFGPMVLQSLCNYGIKVPIDVHLMIEPVENMIPAFADAGAASITFHPEAVDDLDRTIQLIKSFNIEVGIALNPNTSIEVLKPILSKLDIVLVMSVSPGFGGQSFIPEIFEKIRSVHSLCENENPKIRLEVDGGVNQDNVGQIVNCGANSIVAGNAVFGSKDIAGAIKNLKDNF